MRDEISKSLKLIRDIQGLFEQALEMDRAIKIGWGKSGDERPRDGEMGVASHIQEGIRIRLLGNLGDLVAICSAAGSFALEGSCGNMFGAWNRGGNLVVEKDCAARAGFSMEDGRIVVHGSCGSDTGAQMSGGLLVVRGSAGRRCGAGMSGGTLVVMGDVEGDVGCNMTGGRIIVNGRCPPPGEGATSGALTGEELAEVNDLLVDLNLKIAADAICISSAPEHTSVVNEPETGIDAHFEGISLVSPGGARLHRYSPLDLISLLNLKGEKKGILLPMTIIPRLPNGKALSGSLLDNQPCLVTENPRPIDLLSVGENNLHECSQYLSDSAGAVVDLDRLPCLTDSETDALLAMVRGLLGDEKPLLISGMVERVSLIHRLALELDCDAAIANAESPAKLPAAAMLPMVGLSAREHSLARKNVASGMEITWDASASDILICCAGGADFVVVNPLVGIEKPKTLKATANAVEEWLQEIDSRMRGHLLHIGEDGIDQLNRRHLRALDHDTASISGIRLAGYDRPLPHWLGQ